MKKFALIAIVFFGVSGLIAGMVQLSVMQELEKNPNAGFETNLARDVVAEGVAEQGVFAEEFVAEMGLETLGVMFEHAEPNQQLALAQAYRLYPLAAEGVAQKMGALPLYRELIGNFGAPIVPILWHEYHADADALNKAEVQAQRAYDVAATQAKSWAAKGMQFLREKNIVAAGTQTEVQVEAVVKSETEEKAVEDFVDLKLAQDAPRIAEDDGMRRMLAAAVKTQRMGHGFLRRYEILPDGSVKRIWTRSATSILEEFTLGGIERMESKLARGEELTGVDKLDAALDAAGLVAIPLAVFARGTKAVKTADAMNDTRRAVNSLDNVHDATKAANAIGDASRASRTARLSLRIPRALAYKVVGWSAVGVVGYVALKHPTETYQALMWVGEQLGLNPYLFASSMITVAIMLLLTLTYWLWRPALLLLSLLVKLLRAAFGFLERKLPPLPRLKRT